MKQIILYSALFAIFIIQGCAFNPTASKVVTHEDWAYKKRVVVNKTIPRELMKPELLKGK